MADVKKSLFELTSKMEKQLGPKAPEIIKMIKTAEAGKATAKIPKA